MKTAEKKIPSSNSDGKKCNRSFFRKVLFGSLIYMICRYARGPNDKLNSIGKGNLALNPLMDSSKMRCKRDSENRKTSRPKKRLVFLIGIRKIIMNASTAP